MFLSPREVEEELDRLEREDAPNLERELKAREWIKGLPTPPTHVALGAYPGFTSNSIHDMRVRDSKGYPLRIFPGPS